MAIERRREMGYNCSLVEFSQQEGRKKDFIRPPHPHSNCTRENERSSQHLTTENDRTLHISGLKHVLIDFMPHHRHLREDDSIHNTNLLAATSIGELPSHLGLIILHACHAYLVVYFHMMLLLWTWYLRDSRAASMCVRLRRWGKMCCAVMKKIWDSSETTTRKSGIGGDFFEQQKLAWRSYFFFVCCMSNGTCAPQKS